MECRLQSSKQDLENPCLASLSISDIAARNGFNELGHFGRRFKSTFGMSPKDFRREAQPRNPRSSL